MSEEIQKVKEWVQNSRPQFDVIEQDDETIRVVQRLSDNRLFRLMRYPCSIERELEISKFFPDRVHVLCTIHYSKGVGKEKIYLSSCWKAQINGLYITPTVGDHGEKSFYLHIKEGFFRYL